MVARIPLTQGLVALVDDEDAPALLAYKWRVIRVHRSIYAVRKRPATETPRTEYMHRGLLCAPAGVMVDHIDGDGLNNQRDNIRLCSCSENNRNRRAFVTNSTGYKGVYLHRGRYNASIRVNGTQIYLGVYASVQEAAHAYDAAAILRFGEFARLNFPTENGQSGANPLAVTTPDPDPCLTRHPASRPAVRSSSERQNEGSQRL